MLLVGGNDSGMPDPCSSGIVTDAAAGQLALVAPVQLTAVQFKPVATGSRKLASVAVKGPILLTVTV